MPPKTEYRLTSKAAADLAEIATYTISRFGITQARKYRDGFAACFQHLAHNPNMGMSAEELLPSLRRFQHQSHVVFYLQETDRILVIRVLHKSMDIESSF